MFIYQLHSWCVAANLAFCISVWGSTHRWRSGFLLRQGSRTIRFPDNKKGKKNHQDE